MHSPPQVQELIDDLFRRISSNGKEPVGELFTEDGVYEGVYYPNLLDTRETITRFFRDALPEALNPFEQWPVSIHHADDGDTVFVEYQSKGYVLRNGTTYQNRYLAPVKLRNGKIESMREFFNPVLWNAALGPEFAAVIERVFPEGMKLKSIEECPWLSDPNVVEA